LDLTNRIAIVTGGTRGIGRAIATSLVAAGVKVAITARSERDLSDAVSKLGNAGGYVCDVRDYEQVKSTIAQITADLGGIDILVNNAGIGIFETVESMIVEDFRAVLETNVFGVFYCCHEVIPLMKRRGGGYIINISSLAGANPHARMAAYNASKFGLNGFSEALMQEVRHDNIKVSYIMPGSVNTEFGGDSPRDENSWQLQPADIAQAVMDLLEYPERGLVSRLEIRPSRPPKR
jgi:NAD(P)-dependent dehydrogenase (short-subunit alcohol dehydrogenase family)